MNRFRACLLPALLALAACSPRETAVESGNRDQVLHRGVGYEVSGLDPQLATGIAEASITSALFEGLVTEDPKDLHPIPGVAAQWDISPDRMTYTFFLRPEARWSNTDPVTAQDFVDSWRRILTPSLGAAYASSLFVLQGAEAFNKGLTRDFSQVGAVAVDPHTLRVTLEHPISYFLSLLTTMSWLPVHLSSLAASGPVYEQHSGWTRPGHLVGNGAFVLRSWEPDRVIVVEKSPTYWDAAHVRLNAIHFYPIDSLEAEERAFRTGQLHLTDALPLSRIEAYRRDSPQLLRIDPYLDTYFYRLNVRQPGLSDVRVRRALALAVDRRAIVERVRRGGQTPAAEFTPPVGGYTAPAYMPTDFAEARRRLAAAGHPGGEGLPPFELLYNNSESHRLIAEAVQEMWRKELGVETKLINEEEKVVLAARHSGRYQILRSNWAADYPEPSSFLDLWRGDNGNNDTGWSDPEYDSLLFVAARTAGRRPGTPSIARPRRSCSRPPRSSPFTISRIFF